MSLNQVLIAALTGFMVVLVMRLVDWLT